MNGTSSRYPPPESEDDSDDSSTNVEEDEEGEELTPALDAAILRTLAKIKKGDGVYGSERVLELELEEARKKAGGRDFTRKTVNGAGREKPFLLADHHRNALLSGETRVDDDYDEPEPLTNVQTERLVRAEAISAFKGLAESDEEEEDAFVPKPREKGEARQEEDEEEYRRFLLEMGGGEEEVRKVLGMGDQPVSRYRIEEDEEEVKEDRGLSKVEREKQKKERRQQKAKADDDFLMNYILNRGWIDRSEQHVPTYDEVVGRSLRDEVKEEEQVEEEPEAGPSHPWGTLDEDDFDEKAEEFETAYNFRFEEPGAANITSHPREIPSLVRRPDDARKTKRAARAERKAEEKAIQEEGIRRQKGEKRREMEKRLEALREDLGDEGVDWEGLEKVMEGEWDEGEWERIVGTMLARQGEANGDGDEDGKPVWDDDLGAEYEEDVFGDVEMEGEEEGFEDGIEDAGPVNMDAAFEEDPVPKKRKTDKKGKHRAEEPIDIDDGLTTAEKADKVKRAMDEYKALDHEDMIEDLPTRFKYNRTAPVHFGLSPAEILLATDAELNTITSVKHIATYRYGGLGATGKGIGKRVRELKDQLRERRWGEETGMKKGAVQSSGSGSNSIALSAEGEKRKGKRLGKKERMKMKLVLEGDEVQAEQALGKEEGSENTGEKRRTDDGENGDGEAGEGEAKRRRKKKRRVGAMATGDGSQI